MPDAPNRTGIRAITRGSSPHGDDGGVHGGAGHVHRQHRAAAHRGSLSATPEEATWVLTSYLVANAIVLPMTGWLGNYFGRKRVLISCIVMFTIASALCGLAWSLPTLMLARIFQGVGGGAMVPIAQAIMLESFPPQKRGVAMAVFAQGVVVAPILGPTIGGWITDNYSWRWIFYINVPVGIFAAMMAQWVVEDPPYIKRNLKADD